MVTRTVYYEEPVYISEFDDDEVIREACRRIEKRAGGGRLSPDAERAVEAIARLLGVEPGTLPPPSSAAGVHSMAEIKGLSRSYAARAAIARATGEQG